MERTRTDGSRYYPGRRSLYPDQEYGRMSIRLPQAYIRTIRHMVADGVIATTSVAIEAAVGEYLQRQEKGGTK